MKQPGFFRLISALYISPPFVGRLLQGELVERDVDLVAAPVAHEVPALVSIENFDPVAAAQRHGVALGGASLHVRGERLRPDERVVGRGRDVRPLLRFVRSLGLDGRWGRGYRRNRRSALGLGW